MVREETNRRMALLSLHEATEPRKQETVVVPRVRMARVQRKQLPIPGQRFFRPPCIFQRQRLGHQRLSVSQGIVRHTSAITEVVTARVLLFATRLLQRFLC